MMREAKVFEIRDRMTFIPVIAVQITCGELDAGDYLVRAAGFLSSPQCIVARLSDGKACIDPFDWPSSSRTMTKAHDYIQDHFDGLPTGSVIDVEFICGETMIPKRSQRHGLEVQ